MPSPLHPSEVIQAHEADDTELLIGHLHTMMVERDKGRLQQRDVHTKMSGVMRAEFTVPGDLAPELRVGVFAQPATYRAWVRFSNSSNIVKPDSAGDIRGMAIKLMGVPGRKIMEGQEDAATHDFLTTSVQNFLTATAKDTDDLVQAQTGGLWAKLLYGLAHPGVIWRFAANSIQHSNILQIPYFSSVPYAFGDLAVKYVAMPRVGEPDPMPSERGPNFLRDVATAQLAKGDAVFDFCVQFQRDEASTPVEDATVVWPLHLSPPRKVATLRILQQSFDTPERDALGENLSFTPWHCLPEHRPIGAINRARKAVYDQLSTFRHQANSAPRQEPTGWDA